MLLELLFGPKRPQKGMCFFEGGLFEVPRSGYLTAVLREIRRLGSGFSQVDSVVLKKICRVRPPWTHPAVYFLRKTESTSENPDPKRRISRKTAVKYTDLCPLNAKIKHQGLPLLVIPSY